MSQTAPTVAVVDKEAENRAEERILTLLEHDSAYWHRCEERLPGEYKDECAVADRVLGSYKTMRSVYYHMMRFNQPQGISNVGKKTMLETFLGWLDAEIILHQDGWYMKWSIGGRKGPEQSYLLYARAMAEKAVRTVHKESSGDTRPIHSPDAVEFLRFFDPDLDENEFYIME